MAAKRRLTTRDGGNSFVSGCSDRKRRHRGQAEHGGERRYWERAREIQSVCRGH